MYERKVRFIDRILELYTWRYQIPTMNLSAINVLIKINMPCFELTNSKAINHWPWLHRLPLGHIPIIMYFRLKLTEYIELRKGNTEKIHKIMYFFQMFHVIQYLWCFYHSSYYKTVWDVITCINIFQ